MNKRECARPLDSSPLVRSRNANDVRSVLVGSYGARRLDVSAGAERLDVWINHWQSKNIGLSFCSYGAPVEVDFPAVTVFRQLLCLRGISRASLGQLERQVTVDETCIVPPEVPVDVVFGPGYEQLVLRIEVQSLTSKLAAMIGGPPPRDLVFDQRAATDGSALAKLTRMTVFFARELDANKLVPSPEIAELEQALIVSFICNNRHSYSTVLRANVPSIAPWQVRRAEEYIEAHWDEPITIEDLVHVTTASARSLFREFRRSRGYSPMNFVKELRLRRAKEMLSADGPGSVTDAALACGFSNLGHFAGDYLKRFGEHPSDTVRRGRYSGSRRVLLAATAVPANSR
jgi:AraC-like DNA-binding protein